MCEVMDDGDGRSWEKEQDANQFGRVEQNKRSGAQCHLKVQVAKSKKNQILLVPVFCVVRKNHQNHEFDRPGVGTAAKERSSLNLCDFVATPRLRQSPYPKP